MKIKTDKFYLTFDKTKSSLKIKSFLNKNLNLSTLSRASKIIVVGGDGFMLQSLKKYYKFNKPFYGINSGNYGFLMNKFYKNNFLKHFENSKNIQVNPIQMTVKDKKNNLKKAIAINEISLLRQGKQASTLQIKKGTKVIIKKLISDGVLVSTPAGSTAYNLSVHGPILNLDSKKLAITPISPFRPRRWKGIIVNEKFKINIKNLDTLKRPISAFADNYEVRNAKYITIEIKKKITFNLLYNKNNSLIKKIKIEQSRKETGNY